MYYVEPFGVIKDAPQDDPDAPILGLNTEKAGWLHSGGNAVYSSDTSL